MRTLHNISVNDYKVLSFVGDAYRSGNAPPLHKISST